MEESGLEVAFDVHREDVNSHLVVATDGNNQVGIAFTGFDELLVHGLKDADVAIHHRLGGTSSFNDVALYDANQAVVWVGIDKHLQIHKLTQGGVAKGENAFDDDDLARLDVNGLLATGAGEVGVGGLFDGFPFAQLLHMLAEQGPVEGVGVVKVDVLTFGHGDVATVLVVRILWQKYHFTLGKALHNFSHHGGLS